MHTPSIDETYLELLNKVLRNGRSRSDRTGTGTRSIFGAQMRHNMASGFPLLTTKKVHFKSSAVEACWMLRGETNVKFLQDRGCRIWNEWADEKGELGPVYGKQLRDWAGVSSDTVTTAVHAPVEHIDQFQKLVQELVNNPWSRRHVVSLWNPADLHLQALPPCHTLFQAYVREVPETETRLLDIHVYCRSIDIFLGLPFDLSLYGLFMTVLANMTGYGLGDLVLSFGDLHLYNNHVEQALEQLGRQPKASRPKVFMLRDFGTHFGGAGLHTIDTTDFALSGYDSHPAIKAVISV